MKCTHCSADLSPDASFCGDCGQPVPEPAETVPEDLLAVPPAGTCAHCGAALSPGAGFCGDCGQPILEPTETLYADALVVPLAGTCAHCGAAFVPGAGFCGDCGQPVVGSPGPAPFAPAPAAAPPARGRGLWLLALAGVLAIVAVLAVVFVLAPRFRDQPGEIIQVVVTSTPTPTAVKVVVTSTPTPTAMQAAVTSTPSLTATATPAASQPAATGSNAPTSTPAPGLSATASTSSSPSSSPEVGIVIDVEITEVVANASPMPSDQVPTTNGTVLAPTGTAPLPTGTAPAPTDTVPPPTATQAPPTNTPPAPTQTVGPLAGRLAFTSNRHGNPEIHVADLGGGTTLRLTNNPANEWIADWSPDGARLAFTSNRRDGNYDIWAMDGSGEGAAPLVTTGAWDEYARWSPNGQRLAFASTAQTEGVPNSEIFVRQASGELQRLTFNKAENQWPDWSPDGRIVYDQGTKGTSDWDIWIINAGGQSPHLWLADPALDIHPTWSPDGQWIAFVRVVFDSNGNGSLDEEDAGDVWVGAADGSGLRQMTAGLWAGTPAWSPDGRWVAFAHSWDSNGDARMDGQDAANISAVPLEGGEPVSLVSGPHRDADPTWTR